MSKCIFSFFCSLISCTIFFSISCRSVHSSEKNELETKLIFPLQTEHVHGSSIVELPNGDFLAAWFQGAGERWADDVRIMGSRLIKGTSEWSKPFLMADTPGFPDINPMLFVDHNSQLWLWWYPVIANQWESSIPKYRISRDYLNPGAPKWAWQDILLVKSASKTERGIQPGDKFVAAVEEQLRQYKDYAWQQILPKVPPNIQALYTEVWDQYAARIDSLVKGKNMIRRGRTIIEGKEGSVPLGYPLSRRIGWQTKNKAWVRDGRMIVPLYSDLLDATLFAISEDGGDSWNFSNPVVGGAGIQATIVSKKDQSLVAYLRDNGPPPKLMQRTESTDGGLSWSIAKDSNLKNPGAGFDMVTLNNGDWLIVFNDTETGRHKLTVAISPDEGESWPYQKDLENDVRLRQATRSHYPAVIQGRDGRVHVVYSFHHEDRKGQPHKSIKHAVFDPIWVNTD